MRPITREEWLRRARDQSTRPTAGLRPTCGDRWARGDKRTEREARRLNDGLRILAEWE